MLPPIAHHGTFDVANYGDLLLPLVLERRLGDLAPILHVSPVGGPPPIAGGVASIAPEALPAALRGVIVGGGHLIHASPSSLPAYRRTSARALTAYPSLWLGAADRALRAGAPLVWNAPGVPSAFTARAAPVLAWATSFGDYLALRDARSRDLLRAAGCALEIEVVPDTGLEVARLFGAQALEHAYAEAFRRRGVERTKPTLAFHLNDRYLRDEIPLVAARIERICAHAEAMPILLALGPCHGDDALARALAAWLRGPVLVVDRPESLCELAACIAHSQAYVGSSLHGCLTACAYGIRAAIVARESDDGGKFSGFLGAYDLAAFSWRDWESAEARFPELWAADPGPWRAVARKAEPLLERHWSRLRAALTGTPAHPLVREAAAARLEATLRTDLDELGVNALLLRHLAELTLDQMKRIEQQQEQSRALKASYRAAARALRARVAELERNLGPDPVDPDPSP